MNSEKVKEIKECLEVLSEYGETYITKDKKQRKFVKYADILILINELESETERLKEQNGALSCDLDHANEKLTNAEIEVDDYKDRIAELKKEIKENLSYVKGYTDGIKNTYEAMLPQKLENFIKRLKEKDLSVPLHKDFIIIDNKAIDETLKEFELCN